MSTTLRLQYQTTTGTRPTPHAMQAAAMFGLAIDDGQQHAIVPPIEVPLAPGRAVFITGVSGGGKSTVLRLIDQALSNPSLTDQAVDRPGVVWIDRLPALPDEALVDALALPEGEAVSDQAPADFDAVCRWLSLAGLNDAAVMLRRPRALSEGQRHRLRLAQGIAVAERRIERSADHMPEPWAVLLADEFGSTLDRPTAKAMARAIGRWVSKSRVCLVAATAHDDLLEPLGPDVLVEAEPGGRCSVLCR